MDRKKIVLSFVLSIQIVVVVAILGVALGNVVPVYGQPQAHRPYPYPYPSRIQYIPALFGGEPPTPTPTLTPTPTSIPTLTPTPTRPPYP